MKITITREHLLDPVVLVDKMSGKNLSQPVLQCILLKASGDTLTVQATNLEVGIRASVPVAVEEDGEVVLMGSVLSGILQTLPSGSSVTLETKGGLLEVTGANSVARVATQDVNEFPELPKLEDAKTVVLSAKDLKEAITNVVFCASASTIKPELASVFMHFDGSTLITCATDSFRLAEKKTSLPTSTSLEPILLPVRSAHDVLRVLDRAKGEVTCSVGEHLVSFSIPGVELTTRLVVGTFPDYTQILPKDFTCTATVLSFDMEQVLRKASIFTDQFNKTALHLDPAAKKLTVHTESQSVGENTDTIAAEIQGKPCELSFNQRYLNDVFQVIRTDSVLLSFVGEGRPVLISPAGDGSYRYLVMPMNK